jgi:uncharacterized repeat protein (TIGR01451 family)
MTEALLDTNLGANKEGFPMSKLEQSPYTRRFFLAIVLALIGLVVVAVAVVSAASPESGQLLAADRTAAADEADPTMLAVDIVSVPWATLDNNDPSGQGARPVPRVFVVQAVVTNMGPAIAEGLTVTLDYEDTSGNWVLLDENDSVREFLEPLADNESVSVYWFATYTPTVGASYQYTVTADAVNADPVSTSENYYGLPGPDTTVQAIGALNTGSTGILNVAAEVVVGAAFTVTVDFDLSTYPEQLLFSPVGNLDFDPSSYRLLTVKVDLYDSGGVLIDTIPDRLYFPDGSLPPEANRALVVYTFVSTAPGDVRVCPYTTVEKSGIFKYGNDFCADETIIDITSTVSLSLTKQVNAVDILQGEALSYTLTYTNNGDLALGNVWIWDEIDPAIGSIDSASGTPVVLSDHLVAWYLGEIDQAGGAQSTGTFTFTIDVDGGGADIPDQTPAVNNVFYGIDPGAVPYLAALTSTVTTTVLAPTITVTKTDGREHVSVGGELTYTLRVTNSGSVPAINVVVSDLLPDEVTVVSVEPMTTTQEGQTLSWDLASLPNGESRTFTVTVAVSPILPDGTILTNIMTATYENEAGWPFVPEIATDQTRVDAPFWFMTKSDEPGTVIAGEILTYTLTYYQNGVVPAEGVDITDTLPAEVTYGGLVSQPAGWTGPAYDPGPPATLHWYSSTLDSGASGSMVFTVTVNPDAEGFITNTALLTSTTPATYTLISEDTTVATLADLSIAKSGDPATVLAGETLTYTLVVDNAGPSDAQNVTVTDTLPAEVAVVSVEPVTTTQEGQTLSWDLASLPSGESQTFTVTVAVDSGASSSLVNDAEVASETDDPDLTFNSDSLTTPVNTLADLSIAKSGDPATVLAGETLTYTLVVDNAGPSDAQNVTITDTLPAEVTIVSVEPVTTTQEGQTLSWDMAYLPSGESQTLTITVAVDSGASSSLVNDAEVASETEDPDLTFNSDSLTTPVNTLADLSIAKSGDPATVLAGETLTYTLVVDNAGPSDAQNVTVTDTLPAEVAVVSVEPVTTTQEGQTLSWDLAYLPSGESQTFTVTVAVDSGASGSLVNDAEVASETEDPDLTFNSDSLTTPVNTLADLSIAKSGDPALVAAGATLVYTLTYTNNGPSDAQSVTITDTLSAEVAIVSVEPVTTTQASRTLSWDLPVVAAGDSDSIAITVTVDAEAVGSILNSTGITSSTPDDNLDNNTDDLEIYIGDPTRATILGYVFEDSNTNGVWDDGEEPISGVTINLAGLDPQDPTTTDGNGRYYFVVQEPGIYSVLESDPDGYFSTTPNEVHVDVVLSNSHRVDFGDGQGTESAAIYGVVFEDENRNGQWDAVELGLSDVTITLNNAGTTATGPYGAYTFSTTTTGAHTVVEIDPEGYLSTTPNQVDVDVALGNGYEVNFGDFRIHGICTCPGDDYEEDDLWTQASELGVGLALSQTHNFCDDAADWISLTVQHGFVYTMTTRSWGQRADTFMNLYGMDGQTLLVGSDDYEGTEDFSSQIVWQAPRSGVYYLQVVNRSGLIGCETDYDIWIEQEEFYPLYLPIILRDYQAASGTAAQSPTSVEVQGELAPTEGESEITVPTAPLGIITHTCSDSYEVDDTWQQAKPVADGSLQVHSFDSDPVAWAADKDFVWFDLWIGQAITFTVPSVTNTQTLLELYDHNGDLIPGVTGSDALVWTAPAHGRYYLSVSPEVITYGCTEASAGSEDNIVSYALHVEVEPIWRLYLPIVVR